MSKINWEDKEVLVAGGAGMIGSHLSRELSKRGAIVTIVDDLSSGSLANIKDIARMKFYQYDLRNIDECMKVCKGKFAAFQLAADMGGMLTISMDHASLVRNNSLINLNMIEAAHRCGVPNYFYSSSACIYNVDLQVSENSESINLKESDDYPALPNESYGWEKIFAEQVALAYMQDYGMNARIARFHNVYGSAFTAFDWKRGKAPCHMIIKAIKHPTPPFVIWGDGLQVRSFLYIDDCVEMILRLMDSDFKDPINIGSDRAVTIDQLAGFAIESSGKDIDPEYDLTKPQGVRGRNSDNTLMREILKYEPKVPLEEGIPIVYQWAVDNFDHLEGL